MTPGVSIAGFVQPDGAADIASVSRNPFRDARCCGGGMARGKVDGE